MMRYLVNYVMISKKQVVLIKSFFCLLITTILMFPGFVLAEESIDSKTLIIYYSRTGHTELLCEVLQKHINADMLEVNPADEDRYRPGRIGYYTAAFDSVFNRYIPIEPEHPDLSSYASIIIVSPVWNWKLSAPIRSLIQSNHGKFDGKKMVFITNANEEVSKYEMYGDDASFLKRYFRDYLRDKCDAMKSFVESSGCEISGYHHVATEEKTDKQIEKEIASLIPAIKKELQDRINMARMMRGE